MWSLVAWSWGTPPPPSWLELTQPFRLAFMPYLRPGTEALPAQATFLGVTVALATALAILAVLRVRTVTLRKVSRPAGASGWSLRTRCLRLRRVWLPAPSLDFNPVLWHEWRRRKPSRWLRLVCVLYGLLAASFTLFALVQTLRPGRGQLSLLAPWVNGLQVAFGLLLLTVGSVTSLADERASGTLDLLLTTPLPTRSIVLGKWWGSYRTVLWFAVLPLLLAAGAVEQARGWVPVLVLAAILLVYGASVTSLGLALATWVRRTMLALALGVVLYVLVTVGWVFVVLVLFGPGEGAATASPFYAAGAVTALVADRSSSPAEMWQFVGWIGFWLIVHLFTALALLGLTLSSFNHCVGRMGDSTPGRMPRPVRS
jgi:ABC-type transport system involved in multi-copper enzyme maturation permease subunit